MSEPFKLIGKEFIDGERRWTYSSHLIFNELEIVNFTITDYYQKHLPHGITRQIIKTIVRKLHKREMEPKQKHEEREIYVWEYIYCEDKKYRLIFWFKDGTINHLWIRNCYPID
jgi:hypothetical protein